MRAARPRRVEDDVEARRGAAEGRFRRRAAERVRAVGGDAPEKEQAQDRHNNTKQRRAPVTPELQPRHGQVPERRLAMETHIRARTGRAGSARRASPAIGS